MRLCKSQAQAESCTYGRGAACVSKVTSLGLAQASRLRAALLGVGGGRLPNSPAANALLFLYQAHRRTRAHMCMQTHLLQLICLPPHQLRKSSFPAMGGHWGNPRAQ